MKFKLLTYVRHKEQGIEGLVINPDNNKCSNVTIYDPDCFNDDDFLEESYGVGSVLEFHYDDMEEIKKPTDIPERVSFFNSSYSWESTLTLIRFSFSTVIMNGNFKKKKRTKRKRIYNI